MTKLIILQRSLHFRAEPTLHFLYNVQDNYRFIIFYLLQIGRLLILVVIEGQDKGEVNLSLESRARSIF